MDVAARPLAQRLSERLGQPFVVENRAGANGSVAGEATARAAPDGHTLLLANHNILSINAAVQPGLAFNPARDLAPVAQVAAVPVLLVVPSDLPARSLAEFLALARAQSGRLNMGSNGIGGLAHLALAALNRRAGVSIEHVPFRGGAEIARELLGGRLQLGIDPYATFQGPVEAGRLRVLATAHSERVAALPQVPAVAETPGLEGFEASGFYGLVAPAATPAPVLARLEAAVAWAMEGDLPRACAAAGLVPHYTGAVDFAALVAREREKWARVVREAGITAEK